MGASEFGVQKEQRPSGYHEGDYPTLTRADVPQGVEIAMILAETTAGIIGDGAEMPWYLPEDLKHFKNSTLGYPVVMGRTSWEALGKYLPLPDRENFVITRRADYSAPGGHVVASIKDGIAAAAAFARGEGSGGEVPEMASEALQDDGRVTVWILGGGQVYAQCMPIADRVVITEIDMVAPERFQVYAPAMDESEFTVERSEWFASEKGHPVDEEPNGLRYRFETWRRKA